MPDQCVGESHARRPGSDHQVVGLEHTWHCGHSTMGPFIVGDQDASCVNAAGSGTPAPSDAS
jgi:hypothetical protein